MATNGGHNTEPNGNHVPQKKTWIMNAFSMSSPGHVACGMSSQPSTFC